mgnify:CR=1
MGGQIDTFSILPFHKNLISISSHFRLQIGTLFGKLSVVLNEPIFMNL